MIRLIANTVLVILGNAIGLVAAAAFIQGFSINFIGFVWSLMIFSVAQIILAPFVLKLSVKYLPALRGGIALATVLASLGVASVFTDGLQISSLSAWLLAPFVIWVATVAAGVLLPMVIFKKTLENIRDK